MKNLEEIKIYFIKEIDQNELISEKHKNVSTILNYGEHFLVLVSAITGCASISTFASLFVIPVEITSSAILLKEYDYTKENIKNLNHLNIKSNILI